MVPERAPNTALAPNGTTAISYELPALKHRITLLTTEWTAQQQMLRALVGDPSAPTTTTAISMGSSCSRAGAADSARDSARESPHEDDETAPVEERLRRVHEQLARLSAENASLRRENIQLLAAFQAEANKREASWQRSLAGSVMPPMPLPTVSASTPASPPSSRPRLAPP